ncbi:MAG TPA: glycosyltransferase N-terminal domain-containing protein [Candidatus Binataceae bacterium]|nr:glycosyltransferase N-terminal domain-containing protein [Candidatus Binataceae bacterium]
MLRVIYNTLWYPALPLALAAAGARNKQDRRERMGTIALEPNGAGPRIWVHAASVGEVEAIRPVVAGLHRELDGAQIVITTMTAAGRDAARRRIPAAALCALAPLDCPATVRRFLRTVRPSLVVIGETELWPNYFFESRRAGARIAIVNGRISEHSLARYRRAKSLFGPALESAHLILAQSEVDAHRYAALGASRDRIAVTGNTKFDVSFAGAETEPRQALARFAAGCPILVAGSTARGEEAMVLAAWQSLRERFPSLALVIAPRHPARAPEIEELLRAANVAYLRASALEADCARDGAAAVLLMDTMGELRGMYRRATVAFVGGSMIAGRGGQNVGEPAAVAAPVMFGPFHENQRAMAAALLSSGGGAVVRDASELAEQCARWLGDDAARAIAGARAKSAAESAGGAARATVEHLHRLAAGA